MNQQRAESGARPTSGAEMKGNIMKKTLGATALALTLGLAGAALAPMSAQAADPAAITGKVYSDAGTLLKDITIQAVNGSNVVKTTTSNSSGKYYLTGLPAGTYTIKYSDTHKRYLTEYYGDAATVATAKTLTVAAGEKRTGTVEKITHAGKVTGRVFVNGVPAASKLGPIEARLYDSTGNLVQKQIASPTFKFYYLPADGYSIYFCSPNDDPSWIDCAYYKDSANVAGKTVIDVATGEAESGLVQNLTTPKGALLPTIATGVIEPSPVKYGKSVDITVDVASYTDTSTGTVSIQHHKKVVQTAKVVDGKATFRVSTSAWVHTHNPKKVKVIFNATDTAKRSASFTSFLFR
jgi:hypothetical protein